MRIKGISFIKQRISAKGLASFMLLFFLLLCKPSAWSWTLQITPTSSFPPLFLAIDKSLQQLYVLKQQSPLSISRELSCSTGKAQGDKLEEGDLRTPEGVYFVEHKRTSGLNYKLYGNLAFPLNYPNPVDRIRGKTGHGIWIHGRGMPLASRGTKGCVALKNTDIQAVGSELDLVKTPVIIGHKVQWSEDDLSSRQVAEVLKELVQKWSQSWENKSEEFFSFYCSTKFTRSRNRSFAAFKRHKQELFRSYPWIHVYIDDVYALPGPGYWVTYFEQYFRSPAFSSQGVKRLYWQEVQGRWKIVGSEWNGGNWELKKDYLQYVQRDIREWLSAWEAAWERSELEKYISFYDPQARQNTRRGKSSIAEYKKQVWQQEEPAQVEIDDLRVDLHPSGAKLSFKQVYKGEKGYQDEGRKRLVVKPFKQTWRIVNETWSPG